MVDRAIFHKAHCIHKDVTNMVYFMGNEIAQFREWDEKREQDWGSIKYPVHDSFARYMKDPNFAYQNNPALYESDYEKDGFIWGDCHQEETCDYVYERRCKKQRVLVLLNFSDKKQEYELNRGDIKRLKLILASDNGIYGGDKKDKREKVVKRINSRMIFDMNR